MVRKIIHIDMDAFYASVEQRDCPAYRGRPLAVGGRPEQRGVIAAASYEARRYGVRSAMSSYRALRLCPQLLLLPPRFAAYKAVSQHIRAIFSEYTHLIEPLSLDEAYLDVSKNTRFASATCIAKEIKGRIYAETGLTASAGVSYNKFLAKVASDFRKPDGLYVIPPHRAAQFIEALPIDKFYGIGAKTAPRLKAHGIQTGRDLKTFNPQTLRDLLGRSATFYYGLAHGIDDRPVETDWVRKSVGAEKTFARDLQNISLMQFELQHLAGEIAEWLTKHALLARTLTLKVKYSDFQQVTRSRTHHYPLQAVDTLVPVANQLLKTTDVLTRPVRLLGISASNFTTVASNHFAHPPGIQLHLSF